jgi:UDP-glucose 4-epimerase
VSFASAGVGPQSLNPQPRSILVTGGAGYIGSHCVKALMAQGHQVVVLDDLSMGHRQLVQAPHFVHASTLDSDTVKGVLHDYQIEAVMHFAACAFVGESVTDPAKYYRNNVTGTQTLLDAMRATGVTRFIFSSTCATYGNPQQPTIDEQHPQSPINPYGRSKWMVEQLLQDYALAYGLQSVVFRYFNAAGADPSGQIGEVHTPETHLIPLVLEVAAGRRESIAILGDDYPTPDGTCIRDYIHVNDIASAHIAGLRHLAAHYPVSGPGVMEVFNIGTGQGYSVREVINTCEQVTQQPIATTLAARRPGDPPRLVAQADRIRQVLGWQPAYTDLSQIVQTAWTWHQTMA